MEASVTAYAPAKLNLTLEVLSRRGDGLHNLRSLMVPIDLYDELHFSAATKFRLECDDPKLLDENLVERAVFELPEAMRRVRVTLHKRIPIQAGLGGGSSDAAAVLLAAQHGLFGKPAPLDYVAIARKLGADVPFFLAQSGALIEGTGERVTAVGALPPWHAIVVKPPTGVRTADAYRALQASPRAVRPRKDSKSMLALVALQRGDFAALEAALVNDFDAVVFATLPTCGRAREALLSAGAQRAIVTGSGSCVYALAATRSERDAIRARIDLAPEFVIYSVAFMRGDAWRRAA